MKASNTNPKQKLKQAVVKYEDVVKYLSLMVHLGISFLFGSKEVE